MNEGNSNGMAIWIERSHRVDSKDPASEWIIGKLPPVRKAGFAITKGKFILSIGCGLFEVKESGNRLHCS